MAIEYCVRCGKRVTDGQPLIADKPHLCAWCLAKNPLVPTPDPSPAVRQSQGSSGSTTSGRLLPRPSPLQWLLILLLVAAASGGAFFLARRGPPPDPDAGLRTHVASLKTDAEADTAFERWEEIDRRASWLAPQLSGTLAIDLEAISVEYRGRFDHAALSRCRALIEEADRLVSVDKFEEALQRLAPLPPVFLATAPARRVLARRAEVELLATAHRAITSALWSVKFWGWTPRSDALEPLADWDAVTRHPPALSSEAKEIAFAFGTGRPGDAIPDDYFAAQATVELDLPAHEYVLVARSDDGMRVWVDGRVVIDDWPPHVDHDVRTTLALTAGKHVIRVDWYEREGAAIMVFQINPRH